MNLYVERMTTTSKLPEKKTTDAACYDVFADLDHRIVKSYRQNINILSGTARVYGDAELSGTTKVNGTARVYGDAKLSGEMKSYDEYEVKHSCSGDYTMYPGERALIPTGLNVCCDKGWRITVYPRSGIAFTKGITLVNGVGVIDADYRDELCLLVVNVSGTVVKLNHHDRLAQLAVDAVFPTEVLEGKLPPTDSNRTGGIGSTGV